MNHIIFEKKKIVQKINDCNMLQKIRHYNNVAEICEAAPSRQNSLNTFSTQFITLKEERETES